MDLLSRDDFRDRVFARDAQNCVICGETAVDAHHVLERRLFADGGYYLANGASLCERHHLAAEDTSLSCTEIRQAAAISKICLPKAFNLDYSYDKWGNIILPEKMIRGPLFYEEPVQKMLLSSNKLQQFSHHHYAAQIYYLSNGPKRFRIDELEFVEEEIVILELATVYQRVWVYPDLYLNLGAEILSPKVLDFIQNLQTQLDEKMLVELFFSEANGKNEFDVNVGLIGDSGVFYSFEETKNYADLLELESLKVLYEGNYDSEDIFSFRGNNLLRLSTDIKFEFLNSSMGLLRALVRDHFEDG